MYAITITLPKSRTTLFRTPKGTWVGSLLSGSAEKFLHMADAHRKIRDLGTRHPDGFNYEIADV